MTAEFSLLGHPNDGGTPRAAQKGRFSHGLLIGIAMDCDDVSDPGFDQEVGKVVTKPFVDVL